MSDTLIDIHGAGCQRSDPKFGHEEDFPQYLGPQSDLLRVFNFVHLVRDADTSREVFAHVGDDSVSAGQFRSSIILVNNQDKEVKGRLRFYSSQGELQVLSINGVSGTEFPFLIPNRSSILLETDGISDPFYVGWAEATADAQISGSLQFTLADAAGRPLAEAGIQSSTLGQRLAAAVSRDTTIDVDSGLAVVNPSQETGMLTIRVRDQSELTVAAQEMQMGPGQHIAMFVSQLGELPDPFTGTILIDSTVPVGATLIRTVDGVHSASLPVAR
jgi:hypothetical protein